jgi:hypothetical protein
MKKVRSSGLFVLTQTALVTLPERRQREQTFTVFGVPFTTALTLLMLGFQVLLVLRLEWETARPKLTAFPQILHFAMILPPKSRALFGARRYMIHD